MSEIYKNILEDIKTAMKQKSSKLQTLRSINAVVKQHEVDNRGVIITNEIVLSILKKMVKQRNDSIDAFTKANRQDLVEIETFEKNVISEYLPVSVSEEELTNFIKTVIADNFYLPKQLGLVIKAVKEAYVGKNVDYALVSKIAKESF